MGLERERRGGERRGGGGRGLRADDAVRARGSSTARLCPEDARAGAVPSELLSKKRSSRRPRRRARRLRELACARVGQTQLLVARGEAGGREEGRSAGRARGRGKSEGRGERPAEEGKDVSPLLSALCMACPGGQSYETVKLGMWRVCSGMVSLSPAAANDDGRRGGELAAPLGEVVGGRGESGDCWVGCGGGGAGWTRTYCESG